MYPAAYQACGPKGEKIVPSPDRTHLVDAATGKPWRDHKHDPEALHHGTYNVEDYEALTSADGDVGDAAFLVALGATDAATLVRAYTYCLDEVRGHSANQIGKQLCRYHGFTDDDLQLVAEMKNPASPAARTALGLGADARDDAPTFDLPPMETTTHEQATTTFRQPTELPDHPLLAHIPVWGPAEPEFQALKADIIARGVDNVILLDSALRVVDGRNRRNACRAAGLLVPTRIIPDDQVIAAILSALGNRRHLTKGAMAYLLAPLLKPAVEEARTRRAANLATDRPLSGLSGAVTVESLADGYGFGRSLLFQALELHEKFKAKPELRTQFEERILTGELGLGGAMQAIAGKLATEDQPRNVRPPDALILRAVTDLRNRWDGFKTLSEDKRSEVAAAFVAAAPEWPAEIAAATAAAWRKAGLIS